VSPVVLILGSAAAQAFPVVAGMVGSSMGSLVTSHVVTLPSSIAAGNRLLIGIRISGASTTVTTPSGWVLTASRESSSSAASSRVFSRVADGAEGASVTITTSDTRRSASIAARITGATDIEGAFVAADSLDPPSVSPSWGSAMTLWFTFAGTKRTDNTLTAPSGYGNQVDAESAANNTSAAHARAAMAYRTNEASSENPNTWGSTGTLDLPHSATIAVRPA
jgi:hypothetical protein